MLSIAHESPASAPIASSPPLPRQLPKVPPRTRLRLVERAAPKPEVLSRRDPAFIRRVYPVFARISDSYYRAEVEGAENLSSGASLVVSTHNGSWATPDMYALFVAFWRQFGLETPAYGLAHRAVFSVPAMGDLLTKFGALEARRENGRIALRAGHPVLVCPGGDVDALKPYRDRHRVCFGERKGFVKLAISEGVPIVPVVSVGAHEAFVILNDGRHFAENNRIARLFRLKSVPWALSFPFGLTPAGVASVPLPTKVRLRVLPPIHLDARPEDADDPAVVDAAFAQVTQTMQSSLDDLASKRRFPILG